MASELEKQIANLPSSDELAPGLYPLYIPGASNKELAGVLSELMDLLNISAYSTIDQSVEPVVQLVRRAK